MALVLSLRQGHDFYVNDERFIVSWVSSSTRFCLRYPDNRRLIVNDDKWYTLVDDVYVIAGIPKMQDQDRIVNLAIKAPKNIVILRGSLYRAAKRKGSKVCATCGGVGVLTTKVICGSCNGHGCPNCSNGYVIEEFKCPDCEEVSDEIE